MAQSVPAELLADVKNFLDITWEDPATDQKVAGYTAGGMDYLDNKAGEPVDYSVPGYGRTLLMEYVRYARDGALDVFENNYLHLLLAMQHDRRMARFRADMEEQKNAKSAVSSGQ